MFRPDLRTEQMLLHAIAQCERAEIVLMNQLLSDRPR